MLLDSQLQFDPTATAITTTVVSTNIIDLTNARDMGIGDNPTLKVLALVDTTFTTTNSATLQVQFQGSTDSSSWSTYVEGPALAAAALVAGRRLLDIDVPRPPSGVSLPRYLRLNYVVGTGVFSAGKLGSWLVIGRDDIVAYPKNYTA